MIPLAPALLLQVTRADVARMLRADALYLALGALLTVAGVAALALFAAYLRGNDSPLPWLGVFTLLYGLRLLARTDTVPVASGLSVLPWRHLAAVITYTIPVPAMLLLRALFPGWRRPLGWLAAAVGAFALGAIAADVATGRPDAARTPNNLIAIAFLAGSLALLFRPGAPRASPDVRLLRKGLLALALTAVIDNLRGLGVMSWPGREVEPLGSTVLIACLGAVAGRRVVKDARRLLEIDRELTIARRIQSSILPREMPQVPGLAVAARYEPMTAVAGDFYDFLDGGPGRLGVLVADVSGHGVPAALIASMVKIAVAAQRPRAEDPSAVLTGMNETLAGQLGSQYVTAAYLFLDLPRGVVRYAAAGHPPLLRVRPGDGVSALEENGLPLGMMDAAAYRHLEASLRPGERFLLYTDGLVDAANPAGDFFSLERVKSALEGGSALAAPDLAGALVAETRRWSGGTAADDLTVIVVDCL